MLTIKNVGVAAVSVAVLMACFGPSADAEIKRVKAVSGPSEQAERVPSRLSEPTPMQMMSTQMLPVLAEDVAFRGTVTRDKARYELVLSEDSAVVWLDVLEPWSASSEAFDAVVGQEVTVRGVVSPFAVGLERFANDKREPTHLRLTDVVVVDANKPQTHLKAGQRVLDSISDINRKLLGQPISVLGTLQKGTTEGKYGGTDYAIVCPDGSVVGILFVAEALEQVEALVGKKVTGFGRFQITPGMEPTPLTVDKDTKLYPAFGFVFMLGVPGKDTHSLIEPGHIVTEYP